MANKMMIGGAEANFLKTMLDNASKKYTPAAPNTAGNEDPNKIAQLTKDLQAKWAKR
ncbi:hypothetical protein J4434_02850 [Candidatus Woesearchaeota archaeon]|nr:hypothetical protein [Candidatus Woesearchaeota archaeon]